jgi:hypothetical protein
MKRMFLALALVVSVAVVLGVAGCGDGPSILTGKTTTISQPSTTEPDIRALLVESAVPISWNELMAGAPTDEVLKVSGIITVGGIGTEGGALYVDGDPDHMLLFQPLAPVPDRPELPSPSISDFRPGEVTFYGMATGKPGFKNSNGPDMVQMFRVAVVEYESTTGAEGTETTAAEETESKTPEETEPTAVEKVSYSDGVYLVGTDLPAGVYKGVTNGTAGYWQIANDPNGLDVVANDITEGRFYLQVSDGQYLKLDDVTITGVED